MTTNKGLNKCAVLQENVWKQTEVHQEAQHVQLFTQLILSIVSLDHNVLAQFPVVLLVVRVLPMGICYHPDNTCHNKVLSWVVYTEAYKIP